MILRSFPNVTNMISNSTYISDRSNFTVSTPLERIDGNCFRGIRCPEGVTSGFENTKVKRFKGFRFVVVKRKFWSRGYYGNSIIDDCWGYRVSLRLSSDNEEIGWIDVVETKEGFYETHSFIDRQYRKLGLGKELYRRAFSIALKNMIDIRSSALPSKNAKRVWMSKTVNQEYNIVEIDGRFRLLGKNECKVNQEGGKILS